MHVRADSRERRGGCFRRERILDDPGIAFGAVAGGDLSLSDRGEPFELPLDRVGHEGDKRIAIGGVAGEPVAPHDRGGDFEIGRVDGEPGSGQPPGGNHKAGIRVRGDDCHIGLGLKCFGGSIEGLVDIRIGRIDRNPHLEERDNGPLNIDRHVRFLDRAGSGNRIAIRSRLFNHLRGVEEGVDFGGGRCLVKPEISQPLHRRHEVGIFCD